MDRRHFLTATGLAALTAAGFSLTTPAPAHALGPVLGTVLDYAAGVPSAAAVKAAGHLGAVRYVSQRRPGTEGWMIGKPLLRAETDDFAAHGLGVASVYQFGSGPTADWLAGSEGAATHAPQAIAIHTAAGGPRGVPIYAAIDDNPTRAQYDAQIRPYLTGFRDRLAGAGLKLGIYGNYNVIDWAIADGIGEFFWQHDWGSSGKIHPRTTLHQRSGYQPVVDGVTCDVSDVYATNWGQWTPGQPAPLALGSAELIDMNRPFTIPGTSVSVTGNQVLNLITSGQNLSSALG
ncbi:MAG: DUF1906 domain-containing protein [Corynebacterium sp.]|nr:DUF1906 domain-containing protein [Corynebacterium sp.]